MKIRTRLTIRYSALTAVIFLATMFSVYFFSEHVRSETFYRNLKREAVTKAHLFLSGKVDASTMQSVYINNRSFIDEVEVAVYERPFKILYHDAIQNDIVKETYKMMSDIESRKSINFNVGRYQAIGMVYKFKGKEYIITAAAYDGYGYASLSSLKSILILLSLLGLSILLFVGLILAKSALSPVKSIVKKVNSISANNIEERLPVGRNEDELDELSRSFNDLLGDLEKAFVSQKMFVSNVSHELRTPMAALIAETELTLLKPRNPERYREALNNILNDSKRVIKLIEGLLNLARADYNPNQIKMDKVRLDELLMDAQSTVLKAHHDYHIELLFEEEADDDSVITVNGNVYLLTTAFINLMENNCKFSTNKSSQVQIGYWKDKSIIRFTDNGIGIPAKDMENMFQPFYRGKNSSFSPGHGIGLTLANKIITLHNGTMDVNSKENEGTTFIVELPHL